MINAAIENWKQNYLIAKEQGVRAQMQPLISYVATMIILGETCINTDLTEKNLIAQFDKHIRLAKMIEEHIQRTITSKS